MATVDQFKLGEHEAKLETMSQDIASIKSDVRLIRTTLDQRAGERKVATYVLHVASAFLGAGLATLLRHLGVK